MAEPIPTSEEGTAGWWAVPAVALAYFLGGEAGEAISTQAADISAFWPPAGIALGAVLLFGPRALIGVVLGALLGNLIDLVPAGAVGLVAVSARMIKESTFDAALALLEPALAYVALRRAGAAHDPLGGVRHASLFVLIGAVAAPALTALVGTGAFALTGGLEAGPAVVFWLTWFAGDGVGVLVVAPLMIAWRPGGEGGRGWRWWGELGAIVAVVLLIAIPVVNDYPVEYLVLLPLVWVCFRLGLRGATILVLLVSGVSLFMDTEGDGYFSRFEPTEAMLLIQTFVGSVAILPLALIPVLAERRRASEERAKLQEGLLIARSIQEGLLPGAPPVCPGFEIAGWSRPADETGGDAYDWVESRGGRVYVTLGDVTGHGIGPALVAATCHAHVRGAVRDAPDAGELLTRVNALLADDLPSDRFMTLAAACLDPKSGTVLLRSAGQGPICICRSGGDEIELRAADDPPLGIIEDHVYGEARTIELGLGDMIVLLTDGFIEWADRGGELFGTERLRRSLRACAHETASGVIAALERDVSAHADGVVQNDDLTAVVIRCVGSGGGS